MIYEESGCDYFFNLSQILTRTPCDSRLFAVPSFPHDVLTAGPIIHHHILFMSIRPTDVYAMYHKSLTT